MFFALSLPRQHRREYIEYVFKLLLVVITLAFIYGFGQKHFNWPVIVTQNEEYSKGVALRYVPGAHITSTFAGHYDLASFLVLTLPLIICGFFAIKGRYSKLASALVFILGLWLLANSLSRISVISYLGSVTIALSLMKKFKGLFLVLMVSIVVFAFTSALLDRYLSIIQVIKSDADQIMTVFTPSVYAAGPYLPGGSPSVLAAEDRSTSIRLNVEWPRAIRAFTKNPILGTGYSSTTLATDNDYLRLMGEVGLMGLTVFVLIILEICGFCLQAVRLNFSGPHRAYVFGITGALAGVLTNAFFIDIFEASKFAIIFWLLAGLLIFLVRSGGDEKLSKNS